MDSDRERQAASFASGLLLGALIGASVALLTTPRSGRTTRRRIRRAAHGVRDRTHERFEDVATELRTRVEDVLEGARQRLEG